jgi:putative adenylate-forming enzyme
MLNPLKFMLLAKWRFKHWNTAQIKRHQNKEAQKLVNYAKKHSKFYSDFFFETDTTDYLNLPFMNKKLYMENFTDLNTKGLTKEECIQYCLKIEKERDFSRYYKRYLVGMSTGTSGNKGIEFATKYETLMMQFLIYIRFPFPKTRKYHLAFILRVFSPGFSHDGRRLKISYVNPLNKMETIIEQLNELNPNLISGPPSVLQILGKARKEGWLNIKPLAIISYGEVLSDDVRKILSQDFDCPVYEVYKCSESLIGISCKHGNLHINEDTTLVEVHDQQSQPVRPGTPGFVVVSDFIKYGTPIIRYQLNDLITIDPEPCSCGSKFRVIKQVHGRADDAFLGRSVKTGEHQFILPDFIRRSIVRSSNQIQEYNAIQKSPTHLIVKLQFKSDIEAVSHQEIENLIKKNIADIFSMHESIVPEINFQYEVLKHDFDNKLRRIRRDFN